MSGEIYFTMQCYIKCQVSSDGQARYHKPPDGQKKTKTIVSLLIHPKKSLIHTDEE